MCPLLRTVEEVNFDAFRYYALWNQIWQGFATHVRGEKGRTAMRATHRVVLNLLLVFSSIGACRAVEAPEPVSSAVGHAHMDTSCSPVTSLKFDEGLAL